MGIPSWLGKLAGPGLDVINAVAEFGRAKDAGISSPQAAIRAASGLGAGITAYTSVGAAATSAPGLLRMASEALNKQKIKETIGIDPLYGRGVNPRVIEAGAAGADYLNPMEWAYKAADALNPELRGAPNFSQNPNTRLQQIQDFLNRQKIANQ